MIQSIIYDGDSRAQVLGFTPAAVQFARLELGVEEFGVLILIDGKSLFSGTFEVVHVGYAARKMAIELTGTHTPIYFGDHSAHGDTSFGFMLGLAPVELTLLVPGGENDLVAHE